jgi:exopolyphosphatase/guanosine-5'-triphosphate,3'-diphosphate pyrophosphatase
MPSAPETAKKKTDEGYGSPLYTSGDYAPGRLPGLKPIAVIDIGSNSVRLVVYEGITRAPTPIFNEKMLCGLGKSVATTGKLADDAMQDALNALKRFRTLCDQMQVAAVHVLATAAVRDAKNGHEFLNMAGTISGSPVELISGAREARLSALGVISGIHNPDGLVGDLGGGSLELVDVKGHKVGQGITLPLGGLRLIDESGDSLKKAEKIAEKILDNVDLSYGKGRALYAVGGTWRAISRLHMLRRDYPLHVTHGYEIEAREAIDFCKFLQKGDENAAEALAQVSSERRPLVAYGALVLEKILKSMKATHVVMSALGVREGLLFSQLSPHERNADPLLAAAKDLSMLHSRSPRHGEELCKWTDGLFSSLDDEEKPNEKRLRHAACLLADMTWRGHPDYRGEQSLNIIAHGAFIGIDHPGRVFLALAIYHRHEGISETGLSPRLASLADERTRQRAKLLGLAMRVAFIVSASMPGVLPRAQLYAKKGKLKLELSKELSALNSKRLSGRLNRLAKFLNLSAVLEVA